MSEQKQAKRGPSCQGLIITGVLAIILVIGVVFLLNGNRPLPGGEGRIVISANVAIVAVNSDSYADALEAARVGNSYRIDALVQQRQIVLVNSGTRVRVIDIDTDRTRVLILDGAEAGVTGYVPPSFVQR